MRFDQCTETCTTDCGHCKGRPVEALRRELAAALNVPRWDPVAGHRMSPDDNAVVETIAKAIRDGRPHPVVCATHLDRTAACDCLHDRNSSASARNVLKAIVRHLGSEPSDAEARGYARAVANLDRPETAALLIAHGRYRIEDCACGWADLGKSHAAHVVGELIASLRGTEETNRG